MFLLPLPRSFSHEITPPEYSDHYLFFEELHRPYECPEHPANIGLLVSTRGTCGYYVNGAKNLIGGTNTFFISRGSGLAIRNTEKDVAPALLFFHSRLPDLVQHSLLYGGEVLLEKPFDSLPFDFSWLERVHTDARLYETVHSLIGLGSSCSSFAALHTDMVIRQLFEDLLVKNQDAYRKSLNVQAVKASTRLEIFRRISTARDWMEAHYNADITLEDIGAVAAMNSQHFLRMFKQVYSITPHQYIIDLKLRKAKELLETTSLTISEICQNIGFESVFSFSILFKGRFGQPPSALRKAE
ncbi:MAG TPA: AraC family transcriptional regulator [Puia sp.]|uniref:AraC family transcriptional regulator n=1 Tax=Puia sp. TaxID=2045100 RepID=UPI002BF535E3|nr:AraC family transcriptional regulator [Puia sp.]HVU96420.1 AraC family transcriptional regulator [Puia sp.]